ncbi:MAG TPA: tryptophan 2,3-dioxygenase family protein [Polyangiaceae bacterium]|nr:tryptophan 2,3-dioxygenase family protein [Polyangiaceae bacterium]
MKYWDYIKIESLLSLQTGLREDGSEPDKDEVLFIVVHQVYELWFKLILQELAAVRELFRKNPVPDQTLSDAVRSLRRTATIFEVATDHWKVVETLTTRDFLGFREALMGASGFQSAQLREIEIVLGLEDEKRVALAGEKSYKDMLRGDDGKSSPALDRVEARIATGPSYKTALYEWLSRTPIDGSSDPEHVDRYIAKFLSAHEQEARNQLAVADARASKHVDTDLIRRRYERDIESARAFLTAKDLEGASESDRQRRRHIRAAIVFIESHRDLPRLSWAREVLDATLSLEQAMVVWRTRHARMVERVIGRRTGTGGSGGVDYLDQTAMRYRVFDEIWAVRSLLLRRELAPELEHPEVYLLRVED